MEEQELLEKFINYQIQITKEELKSILPSEEKDEYYLELKDKFRKIIENLDELLTLDLEQLQQNIPSIQEKDIKFLNFCKITQESKFIELKEYDIGYLRQILARIDIIINNHFEKIDSIKSPYNNKINSLNDLLERVKKFAVEEEDFDILYELLKSQDLEESIKIMRAMYNVGMQSQTLFNENNSKEEDSILTIETNLDLNDLTELFKKYNIDFNRFSNIAKRELQKYGRLDKIEDILKLFDERNMPLSNYMEEIYLNNRTLHLCRLLIFSSKEKVANILEICRKKNIVKRNDDGEIIISKNSTIIDITTLLKNVNLFISKKSSCPKRSKPSRLGNLSDKITDDKRIEIDKNKNDVQTGRYEDFIKNIELFSNLGLDIGKSFDKCGHMFSMPNLSIKSSIKNLELYGITSSSYLETLSSLKTPNQCELLDIFIELGYFEYIKSSLSYIGFRNINSTMLYKIARLEQLNMPVPRAKVGISLSSEITYDNKNYTILLSDGTKEIIDQINGAQITNKYIKTFAKSEEYDKALLKSDNNTIAISKEDELIKLLDQNYIEDYYDQYKGIRYRSITSRKVEINKDNKLETKSETDEPLVYVIVGIKISRLKVLRIYDTLLANSLAGDLDSLMYAITKNSIITKEQYDAIYDEISNLIEKRNITKRSLIK